MLDLTLREEFRGKRLKGTTVDFTNQSKTGALEVPAAEFLRITYPSFDLLKTIEAIGPGQSRPVVLMGNKHAKKAVLTHLAEQIDREVLHLVPLHDVRADVGLGKIAGALTD